MTTFSANLGFLWTELDLPDAIRAAHKAGFDAVEFHWPYASPLRPVQEALLETGLPVMSVNTVRGQPGENGLAALPGREDEARAAIRQAIGFADAVDARAIHVMAGFAKGDEAGHVFARNLRFACDATERLILVEPLNTHDAPGYFLERPSHAREIIKALDRPNLRMMFDCYHVGRGGGDVISCLTDLMPLIGHIQIASVPDRGAPDHGELDYRAVFDHLAALGWSGPLGAEFRPRDADEPREWLQGVRPR